MNDRRDMRQLLEALAGGEIDVEAVLERLDSHPHLNIDHDRERRCGFPEVVFGEGKELDELSAAVEAIALRSGRALATRVDAAAGEKLGRSLEGAHWHPRSRCLVIEREERERRGDVAIVCAGTSDLPVAEEALITADIAGSKAELIPDIGVAGLHRLMAVEERLNEARVVVVVAGMEGALPSVVAGRVSVPVIAVPTSVGYGAAFGGITALLAMLNSCAPGVSVVNIDNGFGAGLVASRINLNGKEE